MEVKRVSITSSALVTDLIEAVAIKFELEPLTISLYRVRTRALTYVTAPLVLIASSAYHPH
jgi:hypothetical protein